METCHFSVCACNFKILHLFGSFIKGCNTPTRASHPHIGLRAAFSPPRREAWPPFGDGGGGSGAGGPAALSVCPEGIVAAGKPRGARPRPAPGTAATGTTSAKASWGARNGGGAGEEREPGAPRRQAKRSDLNV